MPSCLRVTAHIDYGLFAISDANFELQDSALFRSNGKFEPIKIHHLVPRGHKVADKCRL